MKYYRLAYRASDRDSNSSFDRPVFSVQLPEGLYRNGSNKKVGVCLEEFSGYVKKNTNAHDDVAVVRMRIGAVNGSQTDGTNGYAAIDTLGVATLTHEHTNENFLTCQFSMDKGYLTYPAFQFNTGRLEFNITQLDGEPIEASNSTKFQDYLIILGIKVIDEDDY